MTYFFRPSTHVRQEHDSRVGDQTGMDLRFLFEDIETAGQDRSLVQRFHKSILVHNGASGRINYDDARLHLLEFLGADDVAGVFLSNQSQMPVVREQGDSR